MAEILYGDILLKDNSIFGRAGDIATGDNREQAVGAIVNADCGNFRLYPTMAAGLTKYLCGPLDSRNISASVTDALYLDGWEVEQIDINTDDLTSITVQVTDAKKITDETESLV